jgi:RimJ/RimL family protein N-acetyltransferase
MGVEHPDDLRFAFRWERLVYRALEDNAVDRQFVFEINNDPISTAMGSPILLKPVPMAGFESFMALNKAGVHVAIACLPPLIKDDEGKEGTTRMAAREVTTSQLKETTPIGFVGLMKAGPAAESITVSRCGSLAIAVLTPYTGKGYGREMINWMLDWGFRRHNLHRIELGCWSHNPNAIKLYRSMGFVEEGRSRETTMYDRKWSDTLHFGMLESEWEKLRGISN